MLDSEAPDKITRLILQMLACREADLGEVEDRHLAGLTSLEREEASTYKQPEKNKDRKEKAPPVCQRNSESTTDVDPEKERKKKRS